MDTPTIMPRLATMAKSPPAGITLEGAEGDGSRRLACGDFANFDLLRGYALACPAETEALDGDGDGEMCEPVQ